MKLVLLFAALLGTSFADKCNLHLESQQVDFSKLPGMWFEVLNTQYSKPRSIEPCVALTDLDSAVEKDHHIFLTFAGPGNENMDNGVQTPVHFVPLESGGYEMLNKGKSADNKITGGEVFLHTDYKQYLIQGVCSGDEVKIFVYSRNRDLNAGQVLHFTNVLKLLGEGWIENRLYFTECTKNKQRTRKQN